MKLLAISFFTLVLALPVKATEQDTDINAIDELYLQFEKEMAFFTNVHVINHSLNMFQKTYLRIRDNYYQTCRATYNDHQHCSVFTKSFEEWNPIQYTGRNCRGTPAHCVRD